MTSIKKKPTFGRRAATASSTPSSNITFSGNAQLSAALPDGDYIATIIGARVVTSKQTSAVSVVITMKDEDGTPIRARPLLVDSAGGASTLVEDNRALLVALAGLGEDEEVGLDELLARLAGKTVGVELRLVSDNRGQPVNEIAAVLELEERGV